MCSTCWRPGQQMTSSGAWSRASCALWATPSTDTLLAPLQAIPTPHLPTFNKHPCLHTHIILTGLDVSCACTCWHGLERSPSSC